MDLIELNKKLVSELREIATGLGIKKVEDFKLELEGSSSNQPKNLWTPVRVQL